MDTELFSQQVETLQKRFIDLKEHAEQSPDQRDAVLDVAFQEINTVFEEFRVADEELRQQDEALISAQFAVEAERQRYKDLFDFAPNAYLVTSLDGTIQEANYAAAELMAVQPRFLIGKPFAMFVAEESRRDYRNHLPGINLSSKIEDLELWLQPRQGPQVEAALTVTTVTDFQGKPISLRWLIRDVAARSQAEIERYRLLMEEIKDYAIILMDPEGNIVNWNSGAEQIFGYSETEVRGQKHTVIFTQADRAASIPQKELRITESDGRAEDERWHVRKNGERFWASGVITAVRDRQGRLRWFAKILRDFTTYQQALQRLAADFQREHNIAETLQLSLAVEPAEDAFPGLEVATLYEAASEEAQVGGDFFDAFLLDNAKVAFVVGDISGKGLAAAIRTAEIKSVIRAFLREYPYPAQAMTRLNEFVCDMYRLDGRHENAFMTLCLVVIEPGIGEALVAVAGAEKPLVLRSDGQAEPLEAQGQLLGIEPKTEYVMTQLTLLSGDTLLLVTDGITEARQGKIFLDYTGLTDLARAALPQEALRAAGKAILDGARTFAGGKLQDDACLLLLRRI